MGKIELRERGLLWNPPSPLAVAAFSDIQHNLHGACLADAASVRSGWVTTRVIRMY